MIDRAVVGREMSGSTLQVTRGRLRNFAVATGQPDPVYRDVDAANQAGHRDLPVPPTFFFGVDLESPDSFKFFTDLGVDLRAVLHGEQEFVYHEMAYAGDELSTSSSITDIYEKKDGLLEFIVRKTVVRNQFDAVVAELNSTSVVRHRPPVSNPQGS